MVASPNYVMAYNDVIAVIFINTRELSIQRNICYRNAEVKMSHLMTNTTKWHVHPAKTPISPGICPVWSESLLSAWRKLGSLATNWVHSEDSHQTGWMPSVIWVFAGRTVILLVLSWGGSYVHFISARPRSAEYTIGICFETAKNTKAFEWFFTGFQHSLWKFSATGYLYSLKSWLWLAAVACVVCWPFSNAILNDIWLTCFTRMCNWNYWHKHHVLSLS